MSIITFLLRAALIYIVAEYYTAISVPTFTSAIILTLVLAVLNITLKPILSILTLPINILTLGLFSIVINAVIITVADAFIPSFTVTSFGSAIIFGLIISVINIFINLAS